MKRTLTLKKDTFTELRAAELRGVVGGSMLPCLIFDIVDMTKPGVQLRPSIDVPCP